MSSAFAAPTGALAEALGRAGYGELFFASADEATARTVLLLQAKLSHLGLWRFVDRESSTGPGVLEFLTGDLEGLKATLRRRPREFTAPSRSTRRWSSRERVSGCALHLKHFPGWPARKVQAHIDPIGTHLPAHRPLERLALLIRHLSDHEGYRDIERIDALLRAQGLDVDRVI